MVVNTIQTFCSVTVGCARCHDHKFDPITQEDYYSLQAVFAAIGRNDRLLSFDPAMEQRRSELQVHRSKLIAAMEKHKQEQSKQADSAGQNAKTPAAAQEDTSQLQRESLERDLAKTERRLAMLPPQQFAYAAATHFSPAGGHQPSLGKPAPIHVLRRGQIDDHLEEVSPGTFELGGLSARFQLTEDHSEGDRRVRLANWITDPKNPLTWRSIVNRIWQYHFGQGLTTSSNDFGRMGVPPTHPALLDWLAAEFQQGGEWIDKPQSLKKLHRLIVTSSVYRQSAAHHERNARKDSNNRFLWRFNRRRLDAEEIRDAVLLVAGKLNKEMYGPGFRDFVMEQTAHSPQFVYEKHDPDDVTTHRRSIYRFLPRSQPQPFMEILDCADPSQQVAQRDETITALSALAMLNNRFMVRMSEHFAARLDKAQASSVAQVTLGFQLAVGREPSLNEKVALVAHANKHGLASSCRAIMNLNEFVFVD